MDEDTLNDLKQLIVAAVRQELHDVARKADIDRLDAKIDDAKTEILDAIGDTMEANTAATDEQIADIRHQLATLSPKAA